MNRIFSQIRKTLLKSGKFTGYISYAIGEIILVVLGILIALQINNWNEERKQKNLVKSYYESLYTDLKKDSVEYSRKKYNANRNISKLNNLLRFIENDYNIGRTRIDSVSFGDHVYKDTLALIFSASQAGFLQFPQTYENTISDLRSTGNIKLLRNKELKSKLLEYYNFGKLTNSWSEALIFNRENMETALNSVLSRKERLAYTKKTGLTKADIDFNSFVKNLKKAKNFESLIIGMLHVHRRIIMECDQKYNGYIMPLMKDLKKEY